MKLKRMIIFMLLTVMLILPVASAEARARICPHCGNPSAVQGYVCGGINAARSEYEEHTSTTSTCHTDCQQRHEYGYTVYECGSGCHVHEGYHKCHVTYHGYWEFYSDGTQKYVPTSTVQSYCPYGDYPR